MKNIYRQRVTNETTNFVGNLTKKKKKMSKKYCLLHSFRLTFLEYTCPFLLLCTINKKMIKLDKKIKEKLGEAEKYNML